MTNKAMKAEQAYMRRYGKKEIFDPNRFARRVAPVAVEVSAPVVTLVYADPSVTDETATLLDILFAQVTA